MRVDHQVSSVPAVDPRLERGMRAVVLLGLAAVLVFPAARGYSPWLGWLPLWLLGMPLAGWWALHRFRPPRWPQRLPAVSVPRRRRRFGPAQARRRGPAVPRFGTVRAA